MLLRKFLGFILTTLLTGLFLNFYFVITEEGYAGLFSPFSVLLAGTAPFIILIGLPVSILSDYLTKNLSGKQRYTRAFFIHMIFGLITGFVISFLLEGIFLVAVTLIAAIIFWLVDEILRKKFKKVK